MAEFKAHLGLGTPVMVDRQLEGSVVAVRFFTPFPEYLVAWFVNGEAKSDWFADWRVIAVDK